MKMKRIIAAVLMLVMCAGLCACGETAQTGAPGGKNPAGTGGETPQYTYVSQFEELIKDSKNYFQPSVYTEDGFYATSYEMVGEEIPEGVIPEYEGQYAVYEGRIYFVDNNGNTERLVNYVPLKPEKNTELKDFSGSSSLSGMAVNKDGNLVVLECQYSSWNEGPEGLTSNSDEYWNYYRYEQKYFLRVLKDDGSEISCSYIETQPDEYLDGYNMKLDNDGNIVFSTGMGVRVVGMDGTVQYNITGDNYIDTIVQLADGTVGVVTWDSDTYDQVLMLIDPAKKGYGESYKVGFDVYNAIAGTGEYDLYCSNSGGFYGYKLGAEKAEKLFSWLSCDVNGDSVGKINVRPDGTVEGFISEWDQNTETYDVTRISVKQVPYDSVPHKEVITMATVGLDYNLNNKIAKFNRANDKYRIELIDYSEYNNEKDGWDAGQTKLYTEIMAGDAPDMFSLSGMDYRRLAAQGVLEDLYSYLDKDGELSRDSIFPNVLKAMEVNGKLCTTVSGFYINTLVGASSVVGDKPGWSYDEFTEALNSMPSGCTALDAYVTRSDILQNCLALDMDSYVNWVTGEVRFDSDNFLKLLEFVKTFPESFDWDNYDWSNEKDTVSKLEAGEQMLVQSSVYSINDAFYNSYAQALGGNITYKGYPTAEGTGNMMSMVDGGFGMSSKCRNKDVAWQFLREFFTADYQLSVGYGIPSNMDAYKQMETVVSTIEYIKDSSGNYILDDDGNKVPMVKYTSWDERTGEAVDYYCMSEEQLSQLRELVTTTTKIADYNDSIFSIVSEQAEAFFKGQKSAADVAKLIQSKAHIYINEQR